MSKKFLATEEWIIEMFNYFISELEKDWIDKYKINWDIAPSTIFLAWAPWAWKTEFIETIKDCTRFVIIDIDKYRVLFDWYEWHNAPDFQNFSTKVANKIYKYCMLNKLNVIIDWTFWNMNVIEQNIWQCIKLNRDFWVVFIYQDPMISYYFTKLREIEWKRKVTIEIFIEKFLNSINNVFDVKKKYPDMYFLFAYKKMHWTFETNKKVVNRKIFDRTIKKVYNKENLYLSLWIIDKLFDNKKYKNNSLISKIINYIIKLLWIQNKKDKEKKNNSGN